MQNNIAKKLFFRFCAALLVFSLIIGLTFVILFRQDTVSNAKEELEYTATSVAKTISTYLSDASSGSFKGLRDFSTYLQLMRDTNMADVWIVDDALQFYTAGTNRIEYSKLPSNANEIVVAAFDDKTVVSEGFSSYFGTATITVATPIYSGNYITGVLLMHSPVSGVQETTRSGVQVFLIGILAAMAVSFMISIWLSKNFTDPIVLKEAQEQVRLEKLRRDYVANISHELKTPVTVLRGSLEALVDGIIQEPDDVAEYHREMLHETVYLQRLVGDLLDLSRLQNPNFATESQPLSMTEVVQDAVKSASRLCEEKNIQITTEFTNPKDGFVGDFGRLRQMFLIILDNAIKFSPTDSTIEVRFIDSEISIKDYGSGIDPEKLPHIFERFYKSTSEQNKSGTGLGLAIAREIAVRHNIKVSAESQVGQYTKFNFRV